MEYRNIRLDVEDGIATLTFDRPKVLNAMNTETANELADAVRAMRDDDNVKVVILTGAGGKAFVAGADINEFKGKNPGQTMRFSELGHKALRELEVMDKPSIAAVNGYALGGGLEIAMACDVRFVSEKARFGQPEILLGLIPGWGGTQRLPRLIGVGRAIEFIMSGDQIDAGRAYDMGLANRVCAPDQLMEEAKKFARTLMERPPFALKMAKYAVKYGCDMALDDSLAYEVQCHSQCFSTEDLDEGVTAFLEKRKARFTGK